MPLQSFTFDKHHMVEEYPDNSVRMQYGKGYEFASKPRAPTQVILHLYFEGMRWFLTEETGVPEITSYPTFNMKKLIEFYETHGCYEVFTYPHPWRGTINVRFHKPLQVPKALKYGRGLTEPFEVWLITQP